MGREHARRPLSFASAEKEVIAEELGVPAFFEGGTTGEEAPDPLAQLELEQMPVP